jgi:RNA recognition motif-containing protein
LPFSYDKEHLTQVFTDKGFKVISATVPHMRTRTGMRSKGFGFVEFATEKDQHKAVDELNGFEVEGRPLAIKVSTTDAAPAVKEESQ